MIFPRSLNFTSVMCITVIIWTGKGRILVFATLKMKATINFIFCFLLLSCITSQVILFYLFQQYNEDV